MVFGWGTEDGKDDWNAAADRFGAVQDRFLGQEEVFCAICGLP